MIKTIRLDNKRVKFLIKDKDEHIQKHWIAGAFYEANKNGMLSYMLNNRSRYIGKHVLDIGACIGNHSLFFNKILGMNVTAFEPQEDNQLHLRANVRLNKCTFKVYQLGLSDSEREVSMNTEDPKNIGMYKVEKGTGAIVVPLDSLKLNAEIVKIDVEGHNLEVLKGGKDTIKKAIEVFIECENETILKETDELMIKYGFTKEDIVFNSTPTYLWR